MSLNNRGTYLKDVPGRGAPPPLCRRQDGCAYINLLHTLTDLPMLSSVSIAAVSIVVAQQRKY